MLSDRCALLPSGAGHTIFSRTFSSLCLSQDLEVTSSGSRKDVSGSLVLPLTCDVTRPMTDPL